MSETTAKCAINRVLNAIAMYAYPSAAIESAVNEAVAAAEQRGAAAERKQIAADYRKRSVDMGMDTIAETIVSGYLLRLADELETRGDK